MSIIIKQQAKGKSKISSINKLTVRQCVKINQILKTQIAPNQEYYTNRRRMLRNEISRSIFKKRNESSKPQSSQHIPSSFIANRSNLILRSLHQKQQLIHPESKDKERINFELMSVKNLYHKTSAQNVRLKTRVANLQKQVVELREVVLEVPYRPRDEEGRNKNMVKMKQIIKQQKQRSRKANQQLEALKKSVRVVKLAEMQNQVEKYSQEATRLKYIIQMENKQGKEEANNKMEALRKIIRETQKHNRQLVRDNQDYKYRLKCSLNLIEKVLSEVKKQAQMQYLKKAKTILNVNLEKGKQNEFRKRTIVKNEIGNGARVPNEDKLVLNYKPVERRYFAESQVDSPVHIQNIKQENSKLKIPNLSPKKSLEIIQQKTTQQFALITITLNQNSTYQQTNINQYDQQFSEEQKYVTIDEFSNELCGKTTDTPEQNQASIRLIS